MLEVANLTRYKINKKLLRKATEKALEVAGNKKLKGISLVLVDKKKIRQINKKYRHKNGSTDVLSFEKLNEIFICPAVIKIQANNLKVSFKSELMRVLVHGILHLAGFSHERNKVLARVMEKAEEKILNKISPFVKGE